MKITAQTRQAADAARSEVESAAHQQAAKCYQCGKCQAGCPLAFAMDLGPTQVMRLVQFGQIDELLDSKTIWLCSACETCTTRCPQEVDIARVMDVLRNLAHERGVCGAAPDVRLAHEVFAQNVRTFGRVFEPWLVAIYNLRSRKLIKDVDKGPAMFLKGKIPLLPRVHGASHIRRICRNVERMRASRGS